jgi:hypothetical protein
MKKPRRVRRRLLLPPGWVALGFLLLLCCQAIQPWEQQLRQISVLQLTMPKLKPTSTDIEEYGKEYQIAYKPLAELNKVRPWHDAEFKGEELRDFFSAAATESAVRKIIADTSHVGGVRVRFLPGATYANLVKVLDILTYTNQKKYWLDIRHQPITFYAITTEQEKRKAKQLSAQLGCCTCGPYLPQQLTEPLWKIQSKKLLQRPWRMLIPLLALLIGLSCHQLLFARPNHFNL